MTLSLPEPGDLDALEVALMNQGGEPRRVKRSVDDATATPIFIDYRLGPDWFEGVSDAIDEVEALTARDPVSVMLLAEHAIARLEQADLDDSDGWLMQAIPRLERIHASACRRAEVEPKPLAARLARLAAASEVEAFYDAANTHADALGDGGLRALLRR